MGRTDSLSTRQWEYFAAHGSMDLGVDLDEEDGAKHRFRVNLFRTRGRTALVARRVDHAILSCQDLHLPQVLERVAQGQQGLVLVVGATGSGKSTTLASMIQHINETRACHMVTLEDPIEYLFTDARAVVHQREIGIDVPSFAAGLRSMVREDPDVVLIGEMRDHASFEAALQSAETGHLVFGTVHASSVTQTFSRIYDLFPSADRSSVRHLLAYQTRAVIFQKLVTTIHDEPGSGPGG